MLERLLDPNVAPESLLKAKPAEGYVAATPAQTTPPRTVQMLELHYKNGNRHAIPYMHLLLIAFDPSSGIKVHFATHTLRIRGRNLGIVYEQLAGQSCSVLREIDPSEDSGDADATLITGLLFRPIRRGREIPPSDRQDRSRGHDEKAGQTGNDNRPPTRR